MNYKSEAITSNTSVVENIISWAFGILFFAIGIINTFWGNDPQFGILIVLMSLIYFLPVNAILRRLAGLSIPRMGLVKIILGILILWASLGVGELFDKIRLMTMDF